MRDGTLVERVRKILNRLIGEVEVAVIDGHKAHEAVATYRWVDDILAALDEKTVKDAPTSDESAGEVEREQLIARLRAHARCLEGMDVVPHDASITMNLAARRLEDGEVVAYGYVHEAALDWWNEGDPTLPVEREGDELSFPVVVYRHPTDTEEEVADEARDD